MSWDVVGVIVAIIGLFVAVVQTWISLKQYLESKNLPIVTDGTELRILRALVTEKQGRVLELYKNSSFYREALKSLENSGLIQQKRGKYYLTETGEKVVKKYLINFFKKKRSR